MVTITSQNEQDLINSWFSGGAFIGLYQDVNDPNYSEPSGGWKWVMPYGIIIAEAAGVSTVTATLSAVSGQTVTVTLAASGTATGSGTDYELSSLDLDELLSKRKQKLESYGKFESQ